MCSSKIKRRFKGILVVMMICALVMQIPMASSRIFAAEVDNSFVFSDTGITVTGGGSGYKIEGTVLTITSQGTYMVSGSCSEGSIVIKKGTTGVNLILSDFSLTSSETAPIVAKKETEVNIVLKGTNTLTDNENPDNETSTDETVADAFEGACIKAKSGSKLTISGTGTLNINGNCKNGIKGAATTSIVVNSGNINIKASNTALASDNSVTVNGGTLNITAGNDGIKAEPDDDDTDSEGNLYINGGVITINSDDDAIHAEGSLWINAGTLNISAGDDAIHAEYVANIGQQGSTEGPEITITKSYEGIEGATVNLYSGSATVVSSDDGVNAANKELSNYSYSINIYGGHWYINANGDGLDSNGDINVTGGTTEVFGASNDGDAAIDFDGSWNYESGTVIAVGMSGMLELPTTGNYLLFGSTGMSPAMGGQQSGNQFGGQQGGNQFGGQQGGNQFGGQQSGNQFGGQQSGNQFAGQQGNPSGTMNFQEMNVSNQSNTGISIDNGSDIVIKDSQGNTVYSVKAVKKANAVLYLSDSLQQDTTYTLYVGGNEVATTSVATGNGVSGGARQNGVPQNENSQNGVPQNENSQNGVPQNENAQNGVPQNENAQNGVPQNGNAQNGVPQNGNAQNGVPQNENAQNGVPQNGNAQNGASQNENTQNMPQQNGNVQNGMPQNEQQQNGNSPEIQNRQSQSGAEQDFQKGTNAGSAEQLPKDNSKEEIIGNIGRGIGRLVIIIRNSCSKMSTKVAGLFR